MKSKISKKDFELWCVVLWFIWRNRNLFVHKGKCKDLQVLLKDAALWWYEYEMQQSKLAVAPKTRGAYHYGIGIIIRDDIGMIVVAATRKVLGNFDVFLAEYFAIREGLQLCVDLNIGVSCVETDSSNVVDTIRSP
ncbi:Ribonuclease H-like domain containing protein [Trema orientale]|uniref:Ribonuclease H-like domain containing protein n=1 Tax=Trema orientale TaxID=63057 RepID=A0A2P5E7C0_TREOI|nr:Ribonuclease H-like domain containing protein [Trema orientale]